MALRTWLQKFVALGAMAWSLEVAPASAQQPAPPAGEVPELPRTEVVAEPPVSLAPNFEPFAPSVIEGNSFRSQAVAGYQAPTATTGSWIDMPSIIYPGSINTITEDLRRDQQVIRTQDLVRDISGAVWTPGNGGDAERRPDQFILRGFEMTPNNFRKNGFLDNTYTPRDYANVERVEVLKGPAAVTYGLAQPSGIFNVITKKAQQDRFAVGTFTYGSWNLQRYTIDANNMNQAGDVLFRINAAYQDGESFRDFGFEERTFVAPTATLLLDERTYVVFEAEYNYNRRRYDTGIISALGNTEAFPINRYFGDPRDFFKNHDYRAQISLTREINDDWTFYIGAQSLFFDFQNQGSQPAGSFVQDANGFYSPIGGADVVMRRFLGGQQGYDQGLIANVNGKWNGPLFRHNTVIGTEENWVMNKARFPASAPGVVDPLIAIDPSTGGPYGFDTTTSVDFNFGGNYQRRQSVYFQDLVEVTDRLKALYGVRWDRIDQTYNTTISVGGFPTFDSLVRETYNQGSPRVGLTYELVPEQFTVYGLWTSTFNPIYGAYGNPGVGANRDPELAQIWEAGFKMQLRDNLAYTFSAFNIERQNVAVQPDSSPTSTYLQADQRSKGIEMNLIGNWTERLSTVTNYSYTDASQVDPNSGLGMEDINGRIRGVPFNLANFWTRYNVIQNRNSVLGFGLGCVYVGERRGAYGDANGPVPLELPSYTRWDLGIFAERGPWFATTYVENLFDTRYIAGSSGQYQLYPGAPLNARFQLGVQF